jgi:hypothetical protein
VFVVCFTNCPMFFLLLCSSYNWMALYYCMVIPHNQLDSRSSTKQTTCRQYIHNNKDGPALQRFLWSPIFFGAVFSFHFLSAFHFFSPFSREHHTELYANISHNAKDFFSISSKAYVNNSHNAQYFFSIASTGAGTGVRRGRGSTMKQQKQPHWRRKTAKTVA